MYLTPQLDNQIKTLVKEWEHRRQYPYNANLKEIPAGRQLLDADPQEQRRFVMAAVTWAQKPRNDSSSIWMIVHAITTLLRRRLPFEQDDIVGLLHWVSDDAGYGWQIEPHLLKVLERYLADHERTPTLDEELEELVIRLEELAWSTDKRRRLIRLKELAGLSQPSMPLLPGDIWADAAIAEVTSLAPDLWTAWSEILQQCAAASGGTPNAKWLKAVQPLLARVGADNVRATLVRWFALADAPRATPIIEPWGGERHAQLLIERNADVLKGLAWLCAELEDRGIARALTALAISAYRKLPMIGARCPRVGNACVWALAAMPGDIGIEQLALLKVRVRHHTGLRAIETALAKAAEHRGLTAGEFEELLVPTYGLELVGLRREQLGDTSAELVVQGTSAVELRWLRADGKRLASAPKAVREQHGELVKELTQAAADIKKMLPPQRDRIEQLYLQQRTLPLAIWRQRYLDHPLVGTLARRLIWSFVSGGRQANGIWHTDQIVGTDGQPIAWLNDMTEVALWHPLHSSTEDTLAWRAWLSAHKVQQPFKQAHREIYLLTDAERTTRTYSNRFAAHILRQHQFNALCGARGWKNQLRLMVDSEYPPASRTLPQWNLRAEFWIDSIGGEYGTDTNESGTYLYLTTDQVRFYPIGAAQHYAHASGGGYFLGWGDSVRPEPIPLAQVPALVFSEIMRDVDLFVGVASVGNDPTWADGGAGGRYRDYWQSYAFGQLSEAAGVRRQVLEELVPRLKIGERCQLADRFLLVRGELRSYKIHLGSGNILMEPDNQYLCIVPSRSTTTGIGDSKLFLPFEGDQILAIILSKALLLAKDTKITDQSIVRQIRGRR
jgi:hypothetical protein